MNSIWYRCKVYIRIYNLLHLPFSLSALWRGLLACCYFHLNYISAEAKMKMWKNERKNLIKYMRKQIFTNALQRQLVEGIKCDMPRLEDGGWFSLVRLVENVITVLIIMHTNTIRAFKRKCLAICCCCYYYFSSIFFAQSDWIIDIQLTDMLVRTGYFILKENR